MLAESLADHEFRLGPVEMRVKVRSVGALNAVVRPQGLLAVGNIDAFEVSPAFMLRSE